MNDDIVIRFPDPVTPAEFKALLTAMESAPDRIPARNVFHTALRSDEKERTALDHTLTVGARNGGGELIGALRLLTDHAYVYYILDVMVHPSWRGRGIGTRMLTVALDAAQKGGFIKIFLTAIPGAEGFYERFGFRPSMSTVMTLRGEDYAGGE